MDSLGRFYTEEIFSKLLVKRMRQRSPKTILELGVGGGALIKAAWKRWNNSSTYYGTDIDLKSVKKTNKELSFVKIKSINGLSLNLEKKLNLKIGTVDIAVCNPPFLKLKNNIDYKKILISAGLKECTSLVKLTSDIIFLAQNLQMLRTGGELGIILPDSLITGHEFSLLRKSIINNHKIRCIIQLPDKIFPKTEARTHILFIEKSGKSNNKIPVYYAESNGKCNEPILVNHNSLVNRMDYLYHKWQKENINEISEVTLLKYFSEIKRGSFSFKELKDLKQPYFHTTNFKSDNPTFGINLKNNKFNDKVIAQTGDILLARVGKRCIGKVTVVKTGQFLISDCIYRIRVHKKYQKLLLKAFLSKKGQNWLKAYAHGVCALVISKKDLLRFPVKQISENIKLKNRG